MNKILTRTIEKHEIIEMAEKITESYLDYPIYQAVFGDTHINRDVILYQTWLRIFTCYNRTYTNEDKTVCISIVEPGDRLRIKQIFDIIRSPEFLHGGYKIITLRRIYLLASYGIMNARLHKNIYNPKKDYFVKSLWIDPKLRGGETLKTLLNEVFNGIIEGKHNVYFETDSKKHVRLYRILGAKVCAKGEWKGITHTLMTLRYEEDTVN